MIALSRRAGLPADRFAKLGLIPRTIVVKDAVWVRPQS